MNWANKSNPAKKESYQSNIQEQDGAQVLQRDEVGGAWGGVFMQAGESRWTDEWGLSGAGVKKKDNQSKKWQVGTVLEQLGGRNMEVAEYVLMN